MPTAPHTAAHPTPQANEPQASDTQRHEPFTDKQLTQLIDLRGKISVDEMQGFLRRKRGKGANQVAPGSSLSAVTSPNSENEIMRSVRIDAISLFPEFLDGLMEMTQLLTEPKGQMEFLPPFTPVEATLTPVQPDLVRTANVVRAGLESWLGFTPINVVQMTPGYRLPEPGATGTRLDNVVREKMFSGIASSLNQTSPQLVSKVRRLAKNHQKSIAKRLGVMLSQTGAFKYGLLKHHTLNAIALSTAAAFFPTVLFLVNNDRVRHTWCLNFIKAQVSGMPVVEYVPDTNTVYQLVAPLVQESSFVHY